MGTRYRATGTSAGTPSYLAKHSVPEAPSDIIEQTKRDASGRTTVKHWRKGPLLGKGGFAKCYRVTDLDTNIDWACKIIQKSSLTKQRHKLKLQSEISYLRELLKLTKKGKSDELAS